MIPFRLYLFSAIAAVIVAVVIIVYFKGRADGRASYAAQATQQLKEKSDAASKADDDARRCASDPDCRLSNDGYRRD